MNDPRRLAAVKAAVQRALSTPPMTCHTGFNYFYVMQNSLFIADVHVKLNSKNVCRIRVVSHIPETLDVDAVLRSSQTSPRALEQFRETIGVTLVISNDVEHDKMLSDVASVMRALVVVQLGCEE